MSKRLLLPQVRLSVSLCAVAFASERVLGAPRFLPALPRGLSVALAILLLRSGPRQRFHLEHSCWLRCLAVVVSAFRRQVRPPVPHRLHDASPQQEYAATQPEAGRRPPCHRNAFLCTCVPPHPDHAPHRGAGAAPELSPPPPTRSPPPPSPPSPSPRSPLPPSPPPPPPPEPLRRLRRSRPTTRPPAFVAPVRRRRRRLQPRRAVPAACRRRSRGAAARGQRRQRQPSRWPQRQGSWLLPVVRALLLSRPAVVAPFRRLCHRLRRPRAIAATAADAISNAATTAASVAARAVASAAVAPQSLARPPPSPPPMRGPAGRCHPARLHRRRAALSLGAEAPRRCSGVRAARAVPAAASATASCFVAAGRAACSSPLRPSPVTV